MSMKRIIPAVLTVLIAGAGIGVSTIAKADDSDAAEKAALVSASISLQQAIEAAEAEVGGKAVASGVEDEIGETLYYKVEVRAADGTEKDVLIDMKTGKVAKVMAGDQDDDNDDDTDNDED